MGDTETFLAKKSWDQVTLSQELQGVGSQNYAPGESLDMFDCVPLKYSRNDMVLNLCKRKIENPTDKMSGAVAIALNEIQLATSKKDCDKWMRLVDSITSNRERKIQLLTLVANDWSIQTTCNLLNMTEYATEIRERDFSYPRKICQS